MSKVNEKINENEEEKVSGGRAVILPSVTENRFKGTNGQNFAVICDSCGDAIEGKGGVVSDSKGNNYCVNCAMKKQAMLKESGINERYRFDNLEYAKDLK